MTRHFILSILFVLPLFTAGIFGLSACGNEHEEARAVADSFSVAYFNWQFGKALPYVSGGSGRWLQYAASQVDEADIDSLRAMTEGAQCEITDIDGSDSLLTATIRVRHFLAFDSIEGARHVKDEAVFPLHLTRESGTWKVKLEKLP